MPLQKKQTKSIVAHLLKKPMPNPPKKKGTKDTENNKVELAKDDGSLKEEELLLLDDKPLKREEPLSLDNGYCRDYLW